MGQAITRSVQQRTDCKIGAGLDLNPVVAEYPVFSALSDCDVNCDVIIDFRTRRSPLPCWNMRQSTKSRQ